MKDYAIFNNKWMKIIILKSITSKNKIINKFN